MSRGWWRAKDLTLCNTTTGSATQLLHYRQQAHYGQITLYCIIFTYTHTYTQSIYIHTHTKPNLCHRRELAVQSHLQTTNDLTQLNLAQKAPTARAHMTGENGSSITTKYKPNLLQTLDCTTHLELILVFLDITPFIFPFYIFTDWRSGGLPQLEETEQEKKILSKLTLRPAPSWMCQETRHREYPKKS